MDHGKRKLDNKDVFVRRFNVDNESLNDSQKEAVRLALIQPFTVIQGPPGKKILAVMLGHMATLPAPHFEFLSYSMNLYPSMSRRLLQ